MESSQFNKFLFSKDNRSYYFRYLILLIVNFMYVSFEIYRLNRMREMGIAYSGYQLNGEDFAKVYRLISVGKTFEGVFIILIGICILLPFTKKMKPLFNKIMLINFIVLIFLFVMNFILEKFFNVPNGMFTKLIQGPLLYQTIAFLIGSIRNTVENKLSSNH